LMAIGMENRVEKFEENEIDGAMLVTLEKEELEVDLGCTSLQIKRFNMQIEFATEISKPEKPQGGCCKPPCDWSEAEVSIFLVVIGMGVKVEDFKRNGVTGGMAITLTAVELEKDLCMSAIQVKKFQAAMIVMKDGDGGSNSLSESYKREGVPLEEDEYTASTYPSDQDPTQVGDEAPKTGPKRPVLRYGAAGAAGGAAVGALAGKLSGDTKKGAKVGAAVGASAGIIGGLAERRRQRKAGLR